MPTATKTKPKAADAPAAPTRFVITPDMAYRAFEERNRETDFALTSTFPNMPGAVAKVRIPDLGDPDILAMLPEQLLRDMLVTINTIETTENGQAPLDLTKPDELDIARLKANARQARALADAYCVAGFVDPPLAYSEQERKTARHMPLELVHPADRARFFNWCNAQNAGATATAGAFPDGSAEGVATGGPGGVDGGTTEPVADAGGDGGE